MTLNSGISVLLIGQEHNHYQALLHFLNQTTAVVSTAKAIPADIDNMDALIVANSKQLTPQEWRLVDEYVLQGGSCLTFVSDANQVLPTFFGAQPCQPKSDAEVRLLFADRTNPLGARLPDAFYVRGTFLPLDLRSESVETVLYADWRFEHFPMLISRQHGEGSVALTSVLDTSEPTFQRIVYRLLRSSAKHESSIRTLNVALLGYAPSVGLLHGKGAASTPGMALRTACDLNEARLAVAKATFPELIVTRDSAEIANDPSIDLVIIATPPSSHAALAIKMMQAGKHVVCEKPLALSVAQTKHMLAVAAEHQVHLSCHQNRRWDSDYRAIKQAIDDKLLGDVFYMETFVGGYGHPCGFWHSHDAVSGGTTFDWGAHYLDWMLDLMPGEITGVIGTRQNRLWHDITNADRERIQLRYADGSEAEFTHSDLAYVPKPKWYVVGTEGAIVGKWRQVDAYEVDEVTYYQKHELPAAEMGADLTLKRRNVRGETFEQTLPEPTRKQFPFHANLADHLLLGEPLEVPVAHSARVVAVLEAAKVSAENDGRIESVSI